MIRIDLDYAAFTDILEDVKDKQVPYATSRALNDVAKGIQAGEQAGIARRFILRHADWILRGVKIPRFSDKRDSPIAVTVEMDESAGRGNIMSKFELGGGKVSIAGHDIAVPIGARSNKADLIPPNLRPKALQLAQVGSSIRGNQGTFLIALKSGKRGIFQRIAPGQIRLLYWLTPSVQLPAILEFYRNAIDTIPQLWDAAFRKWFAEAQD